jgi:hypothetical protein
VNEADLLLAAERVQAHLAEQPKESVVVPGKSVRITVKADRRRTICVRREIKLFVSY